MKGRDADKPEMEPGPSIGYWHQSERVEARVLMGPNSVLGHPLGVEGRRRGRRDKILSLSG